MSNQGRLACIYCKRDNFKSARGLSQHLEKSRICQNKAKLERLTQTYGKTEFSPQLKGKERPVTDSDFGLIESLMQNKERWLKNHDLDGVKLVIGDHFEANSDATSNNESNHDDDIFELNNDQDEGQNAANDQNLGQDNPNCEHQTPQTDTWIRDQFHGYCNQMIHNHLPLSSDEKAAIELMYVLRLKSAPLDAYNEVMMWHLKRAGLAHEYETGKDNKHFISRPKLIAMLTKRYNMEGKLPTRTTICLPVSRSKVMITLHDVKAVIQRLLTDPRNNPEDFEFFGGDPRAPPPQNLDYVGHLNTGQAYLQTHAKLCVEEGDQVLAVPLAIDGASISQFHSMELVAVKIALGILTKDARKKEYNWASIGYVEKVPEADGRSRALSKEANHLEEQDRISSQDDSDSDHYMPGVGDKNTQDWHAMVSKILEGFVDLCETGFMWDHFYKGQLYENIKYKVFVPFIRCDNKEADTICARYQNRSTTNQICRYCHILTRKADQHLAVIVYKTKTEIQNLIQKGKTTRLKELSQEYLINAFYELRFSLANDRSIHGACPADMLHSVLLGIFKYLLSIFYEMLGESSKKAKAIDALAKLFCREFARRSDRSLPNANFSKGIRGGGKMMAKEYRGVLLVMLAIFRSTKGREIMGIRSEWFRNEVNKDNWIMLIELLLGWEAYLNLDKMLIKHVVRLRRKHRFILYLMRKIARRQKGMGLKLIKFHVVLHLADDILNFGVPTEFDTSANEGHHKLGKKAAKLTQKEAASFQYQTSVRLMEYLLLELAMEEISTDAKIWEYFMTYADNDVMDLGQNDEETQSLASRETENDEEMVVETGETGINVWLDDETGESTFTLLSRSKFAAKTTWNNEVIDFLLSLQEKIAEPPYMMDIRTWHKRGDQVFRGHPNYRGKGPWKDWVWVNWGAAEGKLPCHIWCFVVLKNMPTGRFAINHGGIKVKDGVYAVVEASALDRAPGEIERSDLMMPFLKEVEIGADGKVKSRTFYLADTEAFVGPCCAVPDIGGPTNRYFVVKPRNEWADAFLKWVKDEHNIDKMDVFPEDLPTPEPSDEDSDEEEDTDESQKDDSESSEGQNSDSDES